jgi:hypothetical protein
MQKQGKSSERHPFETIDLYNPFREDSFSLGLTLLQSALLCSSLELKELRRSEKDLKNGVMLLGDKYSDNIKAMLLLMLQYDSC